MSRSWILLLVVLAGCRDTNGYDPPPLRPEFGDEGPVWRLTYNLGEDWGPSWSPGGDSVYYAAESFPGFPSTPGVLLSVPLPRGEAVPLAPGQLSAHRERWLTSPAPAPAGRQIAFAEVIRIRHPRACTEPLNTCMLPPGTQRAPPLWDVGFWLSDPAAVARLPEQPLLLLPIAGQTELGRGPPPGEGLPGLRLVDLHWYPFQTIFQEERTPFFGPSWAPDGSRLVVSDGSRLHLWTPESGAVEEIPGTEGGIDPEWSPAGDWIAFTRLLAGDSTVQECTWFSPLGVTCKDRRVDFEIDGRVVTLVRPDGSDSRDLAEGDQPAWDPSGRVIYFRAQDRLWRRALDGAAEPIALTEGGGEPAVSPDGRLLAFSRREGAASRDIWILLLEPDDG